MSPAPPPRRFAPEPVETIQRSSRSSRPTSPEKDAKPAPRRFAPQPVETTATSSKGKREARDGKPAPRRFAPEPVSTEHKSSRDRPAAENATGPRRPPHQLVETERKSNEDRPARRFAPQLEEASTKSSSDKPEHVRFQPQVVQTTYRSNRHAQDDAEDCGPAKKTPRKFEPILLDTAKRSRRAGDNLKPLHDPLKTESGHSLHAREHQRHIRGDVTSMSESGDPMDIDDEARSRRLDIPPEMRRQLSPMDGSAPPRRPSVASQRSHSFRLPELDTIESSESERGSNMSSLSSSPGQGSPITLSDSSYVGGKHATRLRESVDENFAHYLLELEAKKAQQRLRDLANEAFPNSDFHEPVQHYVDLDNESDEMEIEDRPVTYDFDEDLLMEMAARRESTAKINWEQMEMQRHAEQLEQERNAAKWTQKQHREPSVQSPWWNPAATYGLPPQDDELRSMRDRARPPMLGGDLKFPRCRSPSPARFDVTQGSTVLRNQMCYLTEHAASQRKDTEAVGLWHPPSGTTTRTVTPTTPRKADKSTPASPTSANGGLWGGFCKADGGFHASPSGLVVPAGPTGLMTPRPSSDATVNPFEQSFAAPTLGVVDSHAHSIHTPPTPTKQPKTASELPQIATLLNEEKTLDRVMSEEYPDSFITQVYNYLSLGYPALARPFDEELSKITRIPIAKLREDDGKAQGTAKGYIRLGSDFEGGGGDGLAPQACARWQALKLYVREWARQEKNMVKVDGPGGNWGTGARRGSWGI